MSVLYRKVPGATIPLRTMDLDLSKAKWLPKTLRSPREFTQNIFTSVQEYCEKMARASSFACIAMLESGQTKIEVEHTKHVVALCSENSIFVAGILLSDPTTPNIGMNIRHLKGNVGHSGIALMVAPIEPSIKTPECDISLVYHQMYDERFIDSFKGTSLHLSFTKWKMLMSWESDGENDQQVFLLESIISFQGKGRWVADLDVFYLEEAGLEILPPFSCNCSSDKAPEEKDIASLDSWNELLDAPPCVGAVRANKN